MNRPHVIFIYAMGFFAIFHWLIYVTWWPTPDYLSTHAIGLLGLWVCLQPSRILPFVLLLAFFFIDAILQAPVYSNHTMLKNFLLLATIFAAVEVKVRNLDWTQFMFRVALAGRWLLVGMYFFGIFHKLNTDFLNPVSSCATALWQTMPFPTLVTEAQSIHIMGIWGTLIIEALIVLLLVLRKTRHSGIILGIAFHALLALSAYEFYPPFSTLTIALHCLFLPPYAHRGLMNSPQVSRVLEWLKSPIGLVAIFLIGLSVLTYAFLQMMLYVALLWLLLLLPFAYVLFQFKHYEYGVKGTGPDFPVLALRPFWIPLLVVLFFFNGFTPYLGLKTAQSFNMFANLSLEGGNNNHLIMGKLPQPYRYLDDLVTIVETGNLPYFNYIEQNQLELTYYDFLNWMERADEQLTVSYHRGNTMHYSIARADLVDDMNEILHPRWFRAWFHFTPVDLTSPKPCSANR